MILAIERAVIARWVRERPPSSKGARTCVTEGRYDVVTVTINIAGNYSRIESLVEW